MGGLSRYRGALSGTSLSLLRKRGNTVASPGEGAGGETINSASCSPGGTTASWSCSALLLGPALAS